MSGKYHFFVFSRDFRYTEYSLEGKYFSNIIRGSSQGERRNTFKGPSMRTDSLGKQGDMSDASEWEEECQNLSGGPEVLSYTCSIVLIRSQPPKLSYNDLQICTATLTLMSHTYTLMLSYTN